MSEPEERRGCRREGGQESDGIFQSEYDGGLRLRLGMSWNLRRGAGLMIVVEQQAGQE